MRCVPLASGLCLALAVVLAPAASADDQRGRLLYENHCTVCHESTVHVREHRRVTDRAGIMAMILRWSTHLGLKWSEEEMRDVMDFLNDEYYGFSGSTS